MRFALVALGGAAALLIGCGGAGVSSSTFEPHSTSGGQGTRPGSPSSGAGSTSVTGTPQPDLGPGADMHGYRPFPANNPWNTAIDQDPVDPNSANLIASIGLSTSLHPDFGANYNGGPFGIPYMVVSGTQTTVPMTFLYADQSDPGPYPIPPNAPVENGSDKHILIIDRDHLKLYETYNSVKQADNSWHADSGAKFDMVTGAYRPPYWTSADAAGLPIFPGLVRYDEVQAGAINHALRFTVQVSRHAFTAPARHWASSNTSVNVPPMGMRVRLKASVDISTYPADCQVILRAMKKYGMFVADNGGNWFVSGAPDTRWDDSHMNLLKQLHGSDFEVVKMGTIVTN